MAPGDGDGARRPAEDASRGGRRDGGRAGSTAGDDDERPAGAAHRGRPSDADGARELLRRSGIEVDAHLHFGMTGSFPLRLGDLFFAADGLYVVEYGYVTPFVGLAGRKHRRESSAMASLYERYGIDAVLAEADSVVWHRYENVRQVRAYTGGRLGRPKVAVYPRTGPSHAFRFHDRPGFEEGAADLATVADRRGFAFDERDALGFAPRESLRRFFWTP